MTTINQLAAEWNAQPHEVATFADLPDSTPWDADLDADTEAMIREAWTSAPAPQHIDAVTENRNETLLMDELHEVVERAGYDY